MLCFQTIKTGYFVAVDLDKKTYTFKYNPKWRFERIYLSGKNDYIFLITSLKAQGFTEVQ